MARARAREREPVYFALLRRAGFRVMKFRPMFVYYTGIAPCANCRIAPKHRPTMENCFQCFARKGR